MRSIDAGIWKQNWGRKHILHCHSTSKNSINRSTNVGILYRRPTMDEEDHITIKFNCTEKSLMVGHNSISSISFLPKTKRVMRFSLKACLKYYHIYVYMYTEICCICTEDLVFLSVFSGISNQIVSLWTICLKNIWHVVGFSCKSRHHWIELEISRGGV